MNRIALTIGTGIVAAASFFGVAYAHNGEHKTAAAGQSTTIVGELLDTACFTASDGDAKGKDHAECAQKCLSTGIPASILPEGKTANDSLVLLTNPKPFAAFAAQTIKVEGTVNEHKHVIDVEKAYVKDGEKWKEIKLDDEHHKMGGGEDAAKEDGHKEHKH